MSQESLSKRLEAEGWGMTHETQDAGGLDRPSVFKVTLTRKGQSFTTEFRKGAAHRKWRGSHGGVPLPGYIPVPHGGEYWLKYRRPGKRVDLPMHFALKKPDDCKPESRQWQQSVFDAFAIMTVPEPPVLAEVLSAMVSDAGSVCFGQTFEMFCDEFGSNPDSREAERIYRGCVEEWQALIRLGADIPDLSAMFSEDDSTAFLAVGPIG